MSEKKESDGSCFGIVLFISFFVGITIFIIYQLVNFLISVWKYFTEPNLVPRIIELAKGFGLCCGGLILFVIIFGYIGNLLTPKYYDDSDDYHASR